MTKLSAYITLGSAQELLGIDDAAHEVVIRLKSRKDIPTFLQWAKDSFQANNMK